MTDLTSFLDRKSLLVDRTEITDDVLECLCELSEESVNFSSLEKFTEKKFKDLSDIEKEALIEKLESADYKKYKNCYLSTSKLLFEKSETLIKEIKALNVLNNLGYSVYLLPFGYARNNQDFLQKSADSIANSQFLEFKNVISVKETAGESAFKDSRKQSNNVFLYYENDINEKTAENAIMRYINASKKNLIEKGIDYNYEGEVFFYFGKTGKTRLIELDKEGIGKEKKINSFGIKNIGRAQDSSVVELFSEKSHPLPKNNIASPNLSVNKNSSKSFYTKEKTMKQKQHSNNPTKVVMRVAIADGEVQAYFPDSVERNRTTGEIVMTGYAHDSQHFEADISYVKNDTLPLFAQEVKDDFDFSKKYDEALELISELQSVGYKDIRGTAVQNNFHWNEINQKINQIQHKEKNMENTKKEISAKELQNYIGNLKIKQPSKWAEAVKEDAVSLVGNYIEWHGEDAAFKAGNVKDLLNGAKDWKQYSEGGMALVANYDIAQRYCTPSELKQIGFEEGGYVKEQPNAKESWMDVQARALFQASELVKKSVHDMEIKREQNVEKKSPAKVKSKDDDFGRGR